MKGEIEEYMVGDGVTVTWNPYSGVVEIHSDGGTLCPDWLIKTKILKDKIKEIRAASGKVYLPEDCNGDSLFEYRLFGHLTNLHTIDMTNFDTSRVTSMRAMFFRCNRLKSVDLRGLDASKVTDMSYMFANCISMKSIRMGGVDTSNVKNMRKMFAGCAHLETLNIDNINTARVTDMSAMFDECKSLKEISFKGWNTSNVTDMAHMFSECCALEILDASKFDMSHVKTTYGMFDGCSNLTEIDFGAHLNMSDILNVSEMFINCTSLRVIKMPILITDKAKSDNIFKGCPDDLQVIINKA